MKPGGPLNRNKPLERKKALESKTQLQRGGWLQRSPFKAKPKNEDDEQAKKAADRAEFEASKRIIRERSGGQCEFMEDNGTRYITAANGDRFPVFSSVRCQAEAQDAHHVKRQSQGHDHSPDNLLAVCRYHHRWIHDHIAEARKLGYLSPAKRGDL